MNYKDSLPRRKAWTRTKLLIFATPQFLALIPMYCRFVAPLLAAALFGFVQQTTGGEKSGILKCMRSEKATSPKVRITYIVNGEIYAINDHPNVSLAEKQIVYGTFPVPVLDSMIISGNGLCANGRSEGSMPFQAPAPKVGRELPAFPSHSKGWGYSKVSEKMSGSNVVEAEVLSDNLLSLRWPYEGQNRGRLYVRQHPRFGLEVYVLIDKGQILCHSDCTVDVKFDQGKPIALPAVGPADHSSTSIFVKSESRFISGAKKAKKIFVQFNMYQNGHQLLEFSTPLPLEWPPK